MAAEDDTASSAAPSTLWSALTTSKGAAEQQRGHKAVHLGACTEDLSPTERYCGALSFAHQLGSVALHMWRAAVSLTDWAGKYPCSPCAWS